MKKLTAIFLAVILLLGLLAGCGGFLPEDIDPADIIEVIDDDGGDEDFPDLPLIPDEKEEEDEPDTEPEITPDVPDPEPEKEKDEPQEPEEEKLDPDGYYYSKDDVALYIHTYGKLPSNFITKKDAEKLGWSGGSVDKYKKGGAIGGTYFGNYEGALPDADGRKWTECDIDTNGKSSRGAKRIVFSNDGLIYYTDDHYETFTQLYDKEGPVE